MATVTLLLHVPGFARPSSTADEAGDEPLVPCIDDAITACSAHRGPLPADARDTILSAAQTLPPRELSELSQTWRSNKRLMCWSHMAVDAGASFSLHAHPNVEVIYVASGTLIEERLRGPPPTSSPYVEGPGAVNDADLTGRTEQDFETRTHGAGSVLANEIGSIHLSYTGPDEGCELFVIWGGCHASIQYPPGFMEKAGGE